MNIVSDFAVFAAAISKMKSRWVFKPYGIVSQRQFTLLNFEMLFALIANDRFANNTLRNGMRVGNTFLTENIHAIWAYLFFSTFFLETRAPITFLFRWFWCWEVKYLLHDLNYLWWYFFHSFLVVILLLLKFLWNLLGIDWSFQSVLVLKAKWTEISIEHLKY